MADWTVQYEANELPDAATPVWTKGGDATTIEISPAGFLHVVSSDAMLIYRRSVSVSDATGATYEARFKVVSGQTRDYPGDEINAQICLRLDSDRAENGEVNLVIYSDSIILYDDPTQYYEMDTTDDYHTYRITSKNGTINVYVDGILRLTSTTGYTTIPAEGFTFEPENLGVAGIETSWDYVYYRTDGAFGPGRTLAGSRSTISSRNKIIDREVIESRGKI